MPQFLGTAADDLLTGTAGHDAIQGRAGADTLRGGDGDDIIHGGGPLDPSGASDGLTAVRVTANLNSPVFAASPPGEPDRLFILEKETGRIVILDLTTNQRLATPFLDIPQAELSTNGEQGLLGLAFHPDYATNGRFFVNVTNADGDIEVWAYQRASADVADVASRELVMRIPHPGATNHNGGWMGFGPDGYLYIATGDGGTGGANAQDLDSLLGKVLRVDIDADGFPGDATRNYAIPPDNPFVGSAGADEVYMLGLRNPWRISFDDEGGLWIADVGQSSFEEINYVAPDDQAGANFGWPYLEGFEPYWGPPGAGDGTVLPIAVYGRDLGRSVTGGYVYEGEGLLQGAYVFADFATDRVWTFQDGVMTERTGEIDVPRGSLDLIASFAQDGRGRLYVIGLDGEVHRLVAGHSAGDLADDLDGGAGDDRLFGAVGDDILTGGTGRDHMDGGVGSDSLFAGGGADFLIGGTGDDTLQGGSGADELSGGAGTDTLNGGTDDDVLYGGSGGDILIGGRGADVLYGGSGDDRMTGGQGADLFVIQGGPGDDVITDFSAGPGPGDVISFGSTQFTSFAQVLAATADDGLGGCVITGEDFVLTLRGVTRSQLRADDFVFRDAAAPAAMKPVAAADPEPLILPGQTPSNDWADWL